MDDNKPKAFRILWGSLFAQLAMAGVIAWVGIEAVNRIGQ